MHGIAHRVAPSFFLKEKSGFRWLTNGIGGLLIVQVTY